MGEEEKKRVLIVDDDHQVLGQLHYEVKLKRMNAVEVDTAKKAIEILQTEKFDCLVLDILMKEGSTESVVQFIKEDGINKDIPVILMSAMASKKFIERNEQKVAKIIAKPFETGTLASALQEVLEK